MQYRTRREIDAYWGGAYYRTSCGNRVSNTSGHSAVTYMDVLIPRAQEVQERCKGSASALGRIETVCPVDKRSSMSGEDTTSELGFLGEAGAELRNRLRAKQIYMEMLLEVLS